MSVEINGIAHIQFTIVNPEVGLPFWESLCHFMGMKTLIRNDETVYCIGGRTGLLARAAPPDKREKRFDQWTAGLHHFCIRARSREDVDVERCRLGAGRRSRGRSAICPEGRRRYDRSSDPERYQLCAGRDHVQRGQCSGVCNPG